jgi:phage regulator Rha-like protein
MQTTRNIQKLDIENKLIAYGKELVLIDSDVATLYGVTTKEVNQAVSNNIDKFPDGYIIELTKEEKKEVVKKFDHLEKLKYSPYLPKVFTEKGLYMLATILKSKVATQTTIHIIETFSKLREFTRTYDDITQKIKKLEKTIQITGQQTNYNTQKLDEAFILLNEILKDTKESNKNLIGFERNKS